MNRQSRLNYDELTTTETGVLETDDGTPFTGVAFELSQKGELVCEVTYVNGVREGRADEFFPGGKLESRDHYLDGSKHGESSKWYPGGQMRAREIWERSILLESETWKETGELQERYRLSPTAPQYRTLELLRKKHAR